MSWKWWEKPLPWWKQAAKDMADAADYMATEMESVAAGIADEMESWADTSIKYAGALWQAATTGQLHLSQKDLQFLTGLGNPLFPKMPEPAKYDLIFAEVSFQFDAEIEVQPRYSSMTVHPSTNQIEFDDFEWSDDGFFHTTESFSDSHGTVVATTVGFWPWKYYVGSKMIGEVAHGDCILSVESTATAGIEFRPGPTTAVFLSPLTPFGMHYLMQALQYGQLAEIPVR
jgi:hypothetical protein